MNNLIEHKEPTIRRWRKTIITTAGALALTACTGAITPNMPRDPNWHSETFNVLGDSHWQLAGAKLVTNKLGDSRLNVSPTDLAIVNQDGSPGTENPPVNLYGTHLSFTGDFSISYTLANRTGIADVSFYSEPPIILDEARAEDGTLRLRLDDKKFEATISDQTDGFEHDSVTTALTQPNNETTVTVTRSDGELSFRLDGQPVDGTLDDNGEFEDGNIWFGVDAKDGTFDITSLTATEENGGAIIVNDSRKMAPITLSQNGLTRLAMKQRKDFVLGTAVATGPIVADDAYREILFENFNGFTSENAGKWQFIHPAPNVFNFTEMDAIVDIAAKNKRRVHGHTLIFGEANPQWVQDLANDPSALKQAAINHITTIMKRYKGKVTSWDVVNEPLADYDTQPGRYGLRQNIWYQALGPDYIATMLRTAHQADPAAELWINDFGMEADSERFQDMLNLVDRLLADNVPLSGIGFQAHIDEGDTNKADTHININMLRSRIRELEKRGLRARFSELDISNTSEHAVFSDVIRACIGEKACSGVTLWGVTSKYSSGDIDKHGGYHPNDIGLLWDNHLEPTKAYADLLKMLR